MINKNQVQHIAKLARLGLGKKEIAKMQKELAAILEFVEKLKEVNVADVKAASHLDFTNVMRKDEARAQQDAGPKDLLDLAAETKDGYVKVKAILK